MCDALLNLHERKRVLRDDDVVDHMDHSIGGHLMIIIILIIDDEDDDDDEDEEDEDEDDDFNDHVDHSIGQHCQQDVHHRGKHVHYGD